jgi:hypothetical protein
MMALHGEKGGPFDGPAQSVTASVFRKRHAVTTFSVASYDCMFSRPSFFTFTSLPMLLASGCQRGHNGIVSYGAVQDTLDGLSCTAEDSAYCFK